MTSANEFLSRLMLARRLFGGPIPFTDSQYYTRAGKGSYWISFGALMVRLARGICSVAARSGATPKSVVPAGNGFRVGVEEGALWLPESDPHDLAAQKRDAETQKLAQVLAVVVAALSLARAVLGVAEVTALDVIGPLAFLALVLVVSVAAIRGRLAAQADASPTPPDAASPQRSSSPDVET